MKRAHAVLGAALLLALSAPLYAEEDAGDTPHYAELKSRSATPGEAQIDRAATLDALLTKSGERDWSVDRAARIEGYVIQVETEPDGDVHVVLASAAHEPDTRKWVIVEVPKAMRGKHKAMAATSLRKRVGQQVRVTGWLYWEPDTESEDPRGTRWELHPVTAIEFTGK